MDRFKKRIIVSDVNLAVEIGLEESIVLKQVDYWLTINKKDNNNFIENRYWTYSSITNWRKNSFPYWSYDKVKRIFKNLEKKDLLITNNFNKHKYDKTKWYSIDYEKVSEIKCDEFKQIKSVKNDYPSVQNPLTHDVNIHQPIPETIKEDNIYNTNQSYKEYEESLNEKIEEFRKKVDIDSYEEKYQDGIIKRIFDVIANNLKLNNTHMKINKNKIDMTKVRKVLMTLEGKHFDYARLVLKEKQERNEAINYDYGFILTVLYNAPERIGMYYNNRLMAEQNV